MSIHKHKSPLTSFTPDGNYFAVLSHDGIVKFWSTSDGKLMSNWSPSGVAFSCMACSFIGKKKKGRGTCLLVLGLGSGEVLAFDVFSGEMKWKNAALHSDGIAGLSFTNRGRVIHTVHSNGTASEISSETGEVVKEFKVSKTPITSSAFCIDENTFAIASGKVRVFNWDSGKEILKFSPDEGSVQHIFISEDKKAIITSSDGEKFLQVWKSDMSTGVASKGSILRLRHAAVALDCKSTGHEEDGVVVLSVSRAGVAYVWNLKLPSGGEISPIKVTVQAALDLQSGGSAKKSRFSIIGARLQDSDTNREVTALVAYSSGHSVHFGFVDLSNLSSDDIVITAEKKSVQENEVPIAKDLVTSTEEEDAAAVISIKNKKDSRKRAASDPDIADTENLAETGHKEQINGIQIDDDINEPTMGEKLASLNLKDNNESKSIENEESSQLTKPPSADSVHVLMKQALHADDRTLLLNCLYTHDEKVIVNSVSLLSPSDVLKLLDSLISIIHSRGVVLAHALPWLRSLLLQHASGIMSQESSLLALNSLYQLIESRVSTFGPALQLSSSLNLLHKGAFDDGADENDKVTPVIFEDRDSEEDEESEDAMDTDQDGADPKSFDDGSDIDDINFD